MGIKLKGLDRLIDRLRRIPNEQDELMLSAFEKSGERLVEIARNTKTYEDKSGNLTASIGYGVFYLGKLYKVGGFLNGVGQEQGHAKLLGYTSFFTTTRYSLIVIAGMDYAAYVERSGRVVLDGARFRSSEVLEEELSKLQQTYERR